MKINFEEGTLRLYFIRYGNKKKQVELTEFNYPDQGLSNQGLHEANITGEYLQRIQFDIIYSSSSDLKRAKQTAF